MKLLTLCGGGALCLFFSLSAAAQSTGRIDCARDGGYVYLYSSMTTLEVRMTLQCGDVVRITGRSDDYYSVRTAAGETGFVPRTSLFLLKDQPGTGLPASAAKPPARERTHYDQPGSEVGGPKQTAGGGFALANNTPIRVKLDNTISSATAHMGDAVELEVVEDVIVEGVTVLPVGSKVSGVVALAEPKKRFGHGGRVAFSITSITLADGEQVKVRCYQEASGSSNTSSDSVIPLSSGKDVAIPKDVEFTALVDGEVRLKREGFDRPKISPATSPATTVLKSEPAH
jgi:Variant SH3 domain